MTQMSTVALDRDLRVGRMGFGALQLTDDAAWGPPPDRATAIAVARRAVELGVTFIDTADSYGLGANEELLAEALHPYPDGLVIATKAGQSRPSPSDWIALGRPEYLRQQAELSLRRLRLDCLELFQLHCVDPLVPFAEQVGALKELRDAGKVRRVGLSQVTVAQIREARAIVEIASVQNRFDVNAEASRDVLEYCTREGLVFIPYEPIRNVSGGGGALADVAREVGATPGQVALAWLLHQSPMVLPIPGTSSLAHLEENVAAAEIALSAEQLGRLS